MPETAKETTVLSPEVVSPPNLALAEAQARAMNFLNRELLHSMRDFAETMVLSKAFPQDLNAPKIMVALQAGFEMGLTPVESVNSFYFVNGHVALWGEVAIAQVVKHGHKVEFLNCSRESATCRITRGDDGRTLESTFTMKDAIERGLATKDTYKKWPENMLKFKAFHMTAKFIVPEVFHGVPLKEEIEDWKDDAITVDPPLAKPRQTPKTPPASPSALESGLADLEEEPKPETPPKKEVKPKATKPRSAREASVDQAPTHPAAKVEKPEAEKDWSDPKNHDWNDPEQFHGEDGDGYCGLCHDAQGADRCAFCIAHSDDEVIPSENVTPEEVELSRAVRLIHTEGELKEADRLFLGSYASRMIDLELSGRKLTPDEKTFLDEYQRSGYMKGRL